MGTVFGTVFLICIIIGLVLYTRRRGIVFYYNDDPVIIISMIQFRKIQDMNRMNVKSLIQTDKKTKDKNRMSRVKTDKKTKDKNRKS